MVVPVKRLAMAKSRLRPDVPAKWHGRLVLALVLDTVTAAGAAAEVAGVAVVTDDPQVTTAVQHLGVQMLPDPGTGLNPAVAQGAEQFEDRPVAVLTGDLPAVRPEEITAALAAAAASPDTMSFVPDASGTGTTLLAAPAGVQLRPQFGAESADRHAATGAQRLAGDWPGLRRDVDTAADLAAAAQLGLGRHTRRLWPPPTGRRRCSSGGTAGSGDLSPAGATVPGVQATVAEFDPDTRAGTLLLDDGRRQSFDAAAFDASGLQLLRSGQRVQVEYGSDGTVQRVTLPTLRGY